jgi:ribosome biogenesis protein Nip4
MIICTPDIFFHPISVMDFKKIFSVVVCAVGIFFSTAAGSKDECLNSYVSADSLLLYEYYETYVMNRPNFLFLFAQLFFFFEISV